ncbi:MAG: hypothetical protein EBU46_02795 [Nitrosomonadaceae bacterium]|nr:hypothetical protein [Nitrosomonadaceae bacterium]
MIIHSYNIDSMIAHKTYFVLIAMNCRTAKIPVKKNGQILPYYRFKNKTCTTITLKSPNNDHCIDDRCKQTQGNRDLLSSFQH